MDTIYLNEFKQLFHKYYDCQNIVFYDINVLLYGNDVFLIDCVLNTNLFNYFNSTHTITKYTYNNIPFEYNQHFHIYDMAFINNNFNEFNQVMQSTAKNKILFNQKLILIIKNLQVLNKQQQNILASIIDGQISYSFIFTTNNISKLCDKLKSRMLCKKTNNTNLSSMLKMYSKDQGITDETLIKDITKQNKDLYSSILHLHTGTYVNVINIEINNLINCIKKIKQINIFIAKIRDVFYKLMIYNLNNKCIVNHIYQCIYNKYKKQQNIVMFCITELCVLDHQIIFSSKPLYHYELFFLKVYKFVNNL